MNLTPDQQRAVAARGNVLVVAGAGTGKTGTLVERCMSCLLEEQPRSSLDEMLVVTFTEAAAADVRQRLRERLEQELTSDEQKRAAPEVLLRWHEQLALFETAHIGTLHSFCLQLVRQHFYELELDPQLAVLAEEEAALLADESLQGVLEKHYAGQTPADEAVRQLIETKGRGWDKPIRELVLRLHHYTQTLADPAGWLSEQLAMFASPEPVVWQQWLADAVVQWQDHWQPILAAAGADNGLAAPCAAALGGLPANESRAQSAQVLGNIIAIIQGCPNGKRGAWRDPLKDFADEAEFLLSLTEVDDSADPLAEDWSWVRAQMSTLLELAREFGAAYTETKRELGMVDFHDLEQHALRLLWDAKAGQPTETAAQWRSKLRFVLVDEYQDINAAQDKIIQALSRDGAQANRFLVGDVKQSIYRFRLAQPAIFQGYLETWSRGGGQVIPLTDNFRSRESILKFINSFFSQTMRREVGGVAYDERAQLRFGEPAKREALSVAADTAPCVELHLRLKGSVPDEDWDEETTRKVLKLSELEEADKEARLVALRLSELKAQRRPVWDETTRAFRPVEWRDMAVLLRSPSGKAESYAKEFARLAVPLRVERGGFYESTEISDLVSLLQLLDNPLQDLPVLAVLHSPLAGLSLDELATIRLAAKGPFWAALVQWQEAGSVAQPSTLDTRHSTLTKVTLFLRRFAHWRRLARQTSLSRCLEAVLTETRYADWLLSQPRGDQRQANVQRLVRLAQQFDQFQRQSLFRFLRFIEAQQEAQTEPEVAAVSDENAVRLISIHQSKGLEFPVVAVADMGKSFNLRDLKAEVILDERYGLCPQVKPPHTGRRYPSLPFWLARERQTQETHGEEIRLLYVAMTRARDLLVLSAAVPENRFRKRWKANPETGLASRSDVRSYADWLGAWFGQICGGLPPPGSEDASQQTEGTNAFLRWVIHDETKLLETGTTGPQPAMVEATCEPGGWEQLQRRLAWQYGFQAATRKPAKTSVTALRRRAAELDEDSAGLLFGEWTEKGEEVPSGKGEERGVALEAQPSTLTTQNPSRSERDKTQNSQLDIGTAHHTFLQLMSLQSAGGAEQLKAEAQRLLRQGALLADEVALLDFDGLAEFWQSELGRRIRMEAASVRRELAFTVRFSAKELAAFTGEQFSPELADEFVVVQGVADLAVILPEELWLVDFKTDSLQPEQLAGRARSYEPQLRVYARALSRIYARPVSECWLYFLTLRQAVAVQITSDE